MPGQYDHHRPTPATTNPYDPPASRIGNYTAQEIATLQSRLDKQLGPEYISARPGNGGGKVYYIAAEKVINIANEVFGFNGWSSQIQNVQVDFCDENEQSGKISLGLSVIMRVTLRDGTFHEDIGYGHIENCKGKAAAFEKAKKEAATDSLKRSLRNFGNVLGNCLYDKEYLGKVTKVKVAPSKWDAENLYRHADFAPVKREAIADADHESKSPHPLKDDTASMDGIEIEDEFGSNLFDEAELNGSRPDEVALADDGRHRGRPDQAQQNQTNHPSRPGPPSGNRSGQPIRRSVSNPMPPPQQHPQPRPVVHPREQQRPLSIAQMPSSATNGTNMHVPTPDVSQPRPNIIAPQPARQIPANDYPAPPTQTFGRPQQYSTPPMQQPIAALTTEPSPQFPMTDEVQPQQQATTSMPPVGFITSRCAEMLNKPDAPQAALAVQARFNPNAESPSIRKTAGVNHGTSAPINRSLITGSTTAAADTVVRPPTNFINPADTVGRRVGLPGGGFASPHHPGRGTSYKPPSVVGGKRLYADVAGNDAAVPRPPLADVSNTHQPTGAVGLIGAKAAIHEADAELAKRQKTGEA